MCRTVDLVFGFQTGTLVMRTTDLGLGVSLGRAHGMRKLGFSASVVALRLEGLGFLQVLPCDLGLLDESWFGWRGTRQKLLSRSTLYSMRQSRDAAARETWCVDLHSAWLSFSSSLFSFFDQLRQRLTAMRLQHAPQTQDADNR